MDDDHLMRYKRHLMLPQLDMAGQERLLASRVLVIGAGGLGSPVLLYLAAAGIGHLDVYDPDRVEVSNLQRQVLHDGSMLGKPKSESARQRIAAINPDVTVTAHSERLTGEALRVQVSRSDLVIDCSDNFTTRFEVNRACVTQARALVSGAVIRMEGQISVFKGYLPDAPCYRCLYREDDYNDETCTSSGVLGPVVGIIGSMQATEAIKILAGIGDDLCGRLLLLDAATMRFHEISLPKDPACPVCAV
jgi:adenylyltransferase/sulfurtransferase